MPDRRTRLTSETEQPKAKEYHGQTTTLWNDRESTSLARRGTPDRTVSARQVHAAHSSGDDARRRDDAPYFPWDYHPDAHGLASLLAHYSSGRAGNITSCLAADDIGGGPLAALC